jgi:hypothetical protein
MCAKIQERLVQNATEAGTLRTNNTDAENYAITNRFIALGQGQ